MRDRVDFIEEQGSALGGLEQAFLVGAGTGERALRVAEQFGFDQRFGQGRTVDRQEGAFGSGAERMHRLRNELLARAAFTGNHDGGLRGGDPLYHFANVDHLVALGHDVPEIFLRLHMRITADLLGNRFLVVEGALDGFEQLVDLERFGDIVECPFLHRLDRGGNRGIGREHDHPDVRAHLARLAEQLHAVDRFHLDIGNQQVELFRLEFLFPDYAVFGQLNLVSL